MPEEFVIYRVLQDLLVICRYEKEKWDTSHCFKFAGSSQNRGNPHMHILWKWGRVEV